jgi:hypothetical protein
VSVTDQALLEEVQYALVEPPDLGSTWPSGLWTQAEMLAYANQRQARLLKETLLQVGIAAPIAVAAGTLRVTLPDDWIRTYRVVWRGSDGVVRALGRDDAFSADHGLPSWPLTRGTPLIYMDQETPTLTLQLAPAPDVDGLLDLYYIPLPSPLDLSPEILTVQDEFAHGLKYGVLADALGKDGRGRDVGRSTYAQQRYELGADLARLIIKGWS